ncbi:hypothetical protein D3C86_1972140 [compost metagenome]
MRITLNPRSTEQLNKLMEALGYENPTHCVQTMITTFLNTLPNKPSIPTIEDTSNAKPTERQE